MKDKDIIKAEFSGNGGYLRFYERYLTDIEQAGLEHKAICPFHDDTNPSLCIDHENGLFYCFGCGAKGDIFNFYARKHGTNGNGNFKKVVEGIAKDFGIQLEHNKNGEQKARKISKIYDYKNEAGKVVHQTVRYEPKSFSQQQPDGYGRWIKNLKGVETVLYNLPEVLKANRVIVVEGEKDADNLKMLGKQAKTEFIPTTSPMGAKKWRPHYNHYLKGKDVVLLPDNDPQGKEHMAQVAFSLYGTAASIKIVELPGLPEKTDVTDFIGSPDDWDSRDEIAAKLLQLIENAPLYEPPTKSALDNIQHAASNSQGQVCIEATPIYRHTDIGNGERFADQHRQNVRYCHPSKKWYIYDGKRWKQDNTGHVNQLGINYL